MPGINLTRVEASERAAIITTREYAVDLDLTQGEETFRSVTVARFDAKAGASTFIDLIAPAVHSIKLNGVDLDPASVYHDSRIALENLAEHNELEVVADCAYMHTGEGLHRFVDPADGLTYLYSQFEVPDSRRVFTVFEQPDLKASFTFTVKTPESWTVFSNSPTPTPVAEQAGTHTFHFAPTRPLSSYVTAIVAGPYVGATDTYVAGDGRQVELGTYCRRSLAEHMDSEEILNLTKAGFEYFEQLFGTAYPFEKYDQIFVPEFNAGAMENAGCVTHRDDYIFRSRPIEALVERRAVTILHELAHMWFGDMVTMKWWNDLWLNESFAEYTSTLAVAEATRWSDAWTTFQTIEKGWAYNQDQLSSTHPVAAEIKDLHDVEVNFDGITYAKGASVLAALVGYVGRDKFFAGIKNYLAAHAYANAEFDDLLRELEATSGRDLSTWARLWLQEAGVTTLRPRLEVDEQGVITSFVLDQEIPAGSPASLRPHRVAIGGYSMDANGKLERSVRVEIDVDGASTVVSELVGSPRPDVILINDDDLTYAKVRLDEASADFALKHITAFTASLPRSIALASAWDMVRDAEISAAQFLPAALEALSVETHSSVVRGLIAKVATVVGLYLPPAQRLEYIEHAARALAQLAQEAAPGSDTQLQLAKAAAAHALTGEQIERVVGWFDGSAPLEGLVVDQDLRWELLISLVAAGRFGEAEIAAEAEHDVTTTGRERASEARCALPSPQAKAQAWEKLVTDASIPNETLAKSLRGFLNVTRHPQLLAPFVEAYGQIVEQVWGSRTFHMAESILAGIFPLPAVGLDDVDAQGVLEQWLQTHTDSPAALQRIVRENLDDVKRVLGAQAVA